MLSQFFYCFAGLTWSWRIVLLSDCLFEVLDCITKVYQLVTWTGSPLAKVLITELYNLQALLHFIYFDSLPDLQELTGLDSKWASTLMSQHLLAAADRYGLDRLRLLCEANLCQDVAINTVATTLALAEQHHCFQLKAVCLRFVAMPENLRGKVFSSYYFYSPLWLFIISPMQMMVSLATKYAAYFGYSLSLLL